MKGFCGPSTRSGGHIIALLDLVVGIAISIACTYLLSHKNGWKSSLKISTDPESTEIRLSNEGILFARTLWSALVLHVAQIIAAAILTRGISLNSTTALKGWVAFKGTQMTIDIVFGVITILYGSVIKLSLIIKPFSVATSGICMKYILDLIKVIKLENLRKDAQTPIP